MTQEQSMTQCVDALIPPHDKEHTFRWSSESPTRYWNESSVRSTITALVTENDKLRAALAQHFGAQENVYERAIDIIEQLIACHEEPTCPAIDVGGEVVAMLRAALATALSEQDVIAAFLERTGKYDATRDACIAAAITADRAARAEDTVPVAWRVREYEQFKKGKPGPWRYFDGPLRPEVNNPDCCDIEPLFQPPSPWGVAPVVSGPFGVAVEDTPVKIEVRERLTKSSDGMGGWRKWRECAEGTSKVIEALPYMTDDAWWQYEVRRLYTRPQKAPQQESPDSSTKGESNE